MASDGSWVIEPQFSYAGQLLDERAIVRKRVDGVSHSGAVDASGKLVVPLKPWLLFYWHSGQAIAQERPGSGQKQALVDKSGNIIGGRWFDKVERAETGDVAAVWIGDRPVGLDRAGNIIDNPVNGGRSSDAAPTAFAPWRSTAACKSSMLLAVRPHRICSTWSHR